MILAQDKYFNFVVRQIFATKLSQRRVINILHENVFLANLQIKDKIPKFAPAKYCKYKRSVEITRQNPTTPLKKEILLPRKHIICARFITKLLRTKIDASISKMFFAIKTSQIKATPILRMSKVIKKY